MKNKLIILFLILNSLLFSEQLKLIGNYTLLSVSKETGKFILYARNNAKSNFIPLTFETFPPTSYFKIYNRDGVEIKFGQSTADSSSDTKIVGDSIIYRWQNKEYKITLDYKLTKEENNKNANALSVVLSFTNLTEKETGIDYFFCLDTYLGEKAKKHFVISNTVIAGEKEFLSPEIPGSIISYDEKSSIGIEIIFNPNNTMPDRLYFANWKRVTEIQDFLKL